MAAFTVIAPVQSIPYLGEAEFQFVCTANGTPKAPASFSIQQNGFVLNGNNLATITPDSVVSGKYKVKNLNPAGSSCSIVFNAVDSAASGGNTLSITQTITLEAASSPINGGYVVVTLP
jgi:hypothetical protein